MTHDKQKLLEYCDSWMKDDVYYGHKCEAIAKALKSFLLAEGETPRVDAFVSGLPMVIDLRDYDYRETEIIRFARTLERQLAERNKQNEALQEHLQARAEKIVRVLNECKNLKELLFGNKPTDKCVAPISLLEAWRDHRATASVDRSC